MIQEILPIDETTEIAIDARRAEILSESNVNGNFGNKEIANIMKIHNGNIITYIKSGFKKKERTLYRQAIEDFKKAKAEVLATKKDVQEVESDSWDIIGPIMIDFLVKLGHGLFTTWFIKSYIDDKSHDTIHVITPHYNDTNGEVEYDEHSEREEKSFSNPAIQKIVSFFNGISYGKMAGIGAAIAAFLSAVSTITKAYRQIKRGSSKKEAINIYKANVMDCLNKYERIIDAQIKYINIIIESDNK